MHDRSERDNVYLNVVDAGGRFVEGIGRITGVVGTDGRAIPQWEFAQALALGQVSRIATEGLYKDRLFDAAVLTRELRKRRLRLDAIDGEKQLVRSPISGEKAQLALQRARIDLTTQVAKRRVNRIFGVGV